MPLSQDDPSLDYDGSWADATESWLAILFDTVDEARKAYVATHRVVKIPYGSYALVGRELRLEMHQHYVAVKKHLGSEEYRLATVDSMIDIPSSPPSSTKFRAGDHILHRPSGEKWVLAVDQFLDLHGVNEVVCADWPERVAKAADCELVRAASDDLRLAMLQGVARTCQGEMRGRLALQQLAVLSAPELDNMLRRKQFDSMIGRLDRVLSEFLEAARPKLDGPDWQTMKHHADDLIGVGNKALEILKTKGTPST